MLAPGDHGSTFGGNPVSCAAALAVLATIEASRAARARQPCSATAGQRRSTAIDHPLLVGHRGVGLWRALELAEPVAAAFEAAAREAGFLVNAVRPTSIRLAPPLVLTDDEADTFAAALPGAARRRVS